MAKVTITIESDGTDEVTLNADFDPPADNSVPAPSSHVIALEMLNRVIKNPIQVLLYNKTTGKEIHFTNTPNGHD
jgi:hypothetical protein